MRLSHLTAVAVLAALAVALFAVIQSASAAPGVVVTINDSDNFIRAGEAKIINIAVLDDGEAEGDYTIEYITVSGGLYVASVDTGSANANSDDATLVVPSNAAGKYTITAGVVSESLTPARLSGELIVTVGDVGDPIGSVEVVLGNVHDTDGDQAPGFIVATSSDEHKDNAGPDSASKPKSSIIGVTVNVLNSLGNKPNGGEISEILIFAPSAFVDEANAGDDASADTVRDAANSNSTNATIGDGNTATSFNFFVSDTDEGTIDVYAVAIGSKGGTATSGTLTLAFTGDADTVEVSDANSPIAQKGGSGYVTVTATDKAGNAADLNVTADAANRDAVSAALKDADDKDVPSSKATVMVGQAPKAGKSFKVDFANDNDDETTDATDCDATNGDAECDKNALRVTVATTDTVGLAAGEYTLEVTLGDNDPVTATIIVAGDAANVELEGSASNVSVGDIVTFTATVTDEDGNVIPDGTNVEFNAVGALVLTGLGGGADGGTVDAALNDGVAMARYVVVSGSGTATIIATHGDGTKAIDGVTSVSTEAEEAMPEEEASVACLSNLAGFATWACGVESSASEIFGLVSGRGATALHLWNGSAWVRYSVVDGTMVPGSSDFMVAENDILYISN